MLFDESNLSTFLIKLIEDLMKKRRKTWKSEETV